MSVELANVAARGEEVKYLFVNWDRLGEFQLRESRSQLPNAY